MPSSPMQCSARRRDGQQCRGPALPGGVYCFAHAPERAEQRRHDQRLGGQRRSNAARLNALLPTRLHPIFERLETALEDTLRGELDPKIATASAAVARALVVLMTAGELETRVRELEARSRDHG